MGSRQPLTWLIVRTVTTTEGKETALLGRASYDAAGDMLTVTTLTPAGRPSETTQAGRHPMQGLAKMLLREMYRDGRIKA